MKEIQQMTSDARQKQVLLLEDGTKIEIHFEFKPMQLGWFITHMVYGDFELRNLRITNSINFLHQFKNRIPFGLSCLSTGDREPSLQEDFSSGASTLYLLSADETREYAEFLSGE